MKLSLASLQVVKIAAVVAVFTLVPIVHSASADTVQEIEKRNQQIIDIQKQIDSYTQEILQNRSKASTLQHEIDNLNAIINRVMLEIKSLGLSINQASSELNDTQTKMVLAEEKLTAHRGILSEYLRLTNEADSKTLTEILFKNETLSDFFNDINNLQNSQNKIKLAIEDIKQLKQSLGEQKDELENKKSDLERLKGLQEIERQSLDTNKLQKDRIYKETKGQESKYQQLVKQSQLNIEKLRGEIFYLQKNGVSAEDAVTFGKLAASRAGIRPAFLLAILEIESGLGRNVGTGNWLDDMYKCYLRLGKPARAETEKAAFLEIVQKLNLDPTTVKVSREPNYGCGGALGPAQFIPSTWLGYEADVIAQTGHNPPNPWLIEDAFTASAIKLSRGGATSQDRAGEDRAARAYISGKGTCTTTACNSYANAVLRKADEINQNL